MAMSLSRRPRDLHRNGLECTHMISRISDLRIQQAQQHGCIVGLPKDFAEEVAALADFLMDCHIWSDVTLPFDGKVMPHGAGFWRVPLRDGWWLKFAWVPPYGPVDVQLWQDGDG
tara:strand:+ start:1630 stop:1974 length:345 start_codon:yes stop_codon:yes gene_type:complete